MSAKRTPYWAAALIALVFTLVPAPVSTEQTARLSDTLVQMQIEQRLFEAGVTDVVVEVHDGTATLRGSVRSLWLKDQAAQQARKVHDVTTVISALTVERVESDEWLARTVLDAVSACPVFTMFDDVTVQVANGTTTLTGFVTTSNKSREYANVTSRVRGVQQVVNRIEVLPVSAMDDDLRLEIGVGISRSPVFSSYPNLRSGPVHVIVRDGTVRLTGVVGSEVERRTAELIARDAMGTWSVDNQLRLRN